jgi:hypothetical protein
MDVTLTSANDRVNISAQNPRQQCAADALRITIGHQYFAAAIGVHTGNHTGGFHRFNQTRSAVIAYTQLSLHRRDRCSAGFQHKGDGFVI